jgi:hypothetical protein
LQNRKQLVSRVRQSANMREDLNSMDGSLVCRRLTIGASHRLCGRFGAGPEVGKRTILNSEALAQLFYRNAANFVRLAPGVTGQSQGTYTSDNQTAISINGGGGFRAANEWVLDVMPDTVPPVDGSIVVVPSLDSVGK